MPLAGIVTLIGVALIVAALAIYLIWVAVLLRTVSFNLGTIIAGVRAIAMQAQPLGQRFRQINTNLGASQQTLHRFVEGLDPQHQAGYSPSVEANAPISGPGTQADPEGGASATASASSPRSARQSTSHQPTGRSR
ncbi:MAG: hypothetical protein BRC32_06485 [Actinobacteria bacterium QS_8_72_14]|nr:MAG: hypothetical protein BRC32_06485 [Actinobacteria bacterium QS_8_72_14]